MMYVGFFLLAVAVAAVVIGFIQRSKMKRILAAPFKPTAQALSSPDDKGLVSFQGQIQPAQELVAPCSGQACIYYEIEIKQEWEKTVQTEDGSKKETGTESAQNEKIGSMFYINDGSGPVAVNGTEGVDAKLEQTFDEKKSYGWGDLTFGGYSTHVNRPSDSDKYATATRCIEKIIPATGELFVLGKVEGQAVQKRDGMLGKLMLAREGRDGLLGSTKRNMTIAFAAAGLLVPAGGGMAIFGDAPESAADACVAMQDDIEQPCIGRVHDSDVAYEWKVTEEADYTFAAFGTGKDESMRLWPALNIAKKDGETVFTLENSGPDGVKGEHHFTPGTYTISINDTSDGHAAKLKGGAGFELEIDQVPGTKKETEGEAVADADDKGEAGDTVAAKSKPVTGTTKAKSVPAKGKTTTAKAKADDKPEAKAEDKPAEEKPAETKTDDKPAEEKPADKPAEEKPAEEKKPTVKPRFRIPGKD
jgi:E3 Ubiquitin ligase